MKPGHLQVGMMLQEVGAEYGSTTAPLDEGGDVAGWIWFLAGHLGEVGKNW